MSQEVLYRKWRPQRFGDVAGQDPVTTTLRHAVSAGAPSHAYLFSGPRGTGKTTTGRLLAKAVNCEAPLPDGEPCNACVTCEAFSSGRALDLIELDAASNRGIDEIRDLREGTGYAPNAARYKVYLIDEVHMLTPAAFNALLKTLEEPPPHVIFILATTEPHAIPATIVSRCQRFDFRRIGLEASIARLRTIADGEGIDVPDAGLDLIAREGTGSLRDAVNLLDQTVAYHGRTLSLESVRSGLGLLVDRRTNELARAAIAKDLNAGLSVLASARDDGIEIRAFMREVIGALRSVLMIRAGGAEQLGLADAEVTALEGLAEGARIDDVVAALRAFGELDFRGDAYDSLPAEIAFATLAVGLDAPVAASVPAPATTAAPVAPRVETRAREAAAPRQPERQQPVRQQPVRQQPVRQQAVQERAPRAPEARPPAERASGPQEASALAPREAAAPPRDASTPAAATVASKGAPAAPAFAPPDTGDVTPELESIRARWDDIRAAARARHHRAGAMLNSQCFIKSFEGDRVEIGFSAPILIEKTQTMEEGAVMRAIRDVVIEAVGRPVEVDLVLWEDLQRAGSAPAPKARAGVSHLVDEALKQGARPVEGGSGG